MILITTATKAIGAHATKGMMNSLNGNNYSSSDSSVKNTYNGIKHAPTYPKGF